MTDFIRTDLLRDILGFVQFCSSGGLFPVQYIQWTSIWLCWFTNTYYGDPSSHMYLVFDFRRNPSSKEELFFAVIHLVFLRSSSAIQCENIYQKFGI